LAPPCTCVKSRKAEIHRGSFCFLPRSLVNRFTNKFLIIHFSMHPLSLSILSSITQSLHKPPFLLTTARTGLNHHTSTTERSRQFAV
jgi:hypothetical protein